MNTAGNLIWFLLGGFIIVILYIVGSFILFITIIGIPFGIQTMKMAVLAIAPFGKEAIQTERASGCLHILMNIIWVLFAGIELAVTHLMLALLFGIKSIGLPFAKQHNKKALLALIPFGMEIRDRSKN